MFFTWLNEERSLFSFYLFFLTYILKLLFCFLFFFKINYTKKLSIFKFKLTNGINFNSDLIDCIYYGILYINKILIFEIIFCPLLFFGFVNLRWINWMSSCKKKRQTKNMWKYLHLDIFYLHLKKVIRMILKLGSIPVK